MARLSVTRLALAASGVVAIAAGGCASSGIIDHEHYVYTADFINRSDRPIAVQTFAGTRGAQHSSQAMVAPGDTFRLAFSTTDSRADAEAHLRLHFEPRMLADGGAPDLSGTTVVPLEPGIVEFDVRVRDGVVVAERRAPTSRD